MINDIDLRAFSKFRIGDRVRCEDGTEGVVRGMLTTFPSSNTGVIGYQDLSNPSLLYTVQIAEESDRLCWGEDITNMIYQMQFDFMYDESDWIAPISREETFSVVYVKTMDEMLNTRNS